MIKIKTIAMAKHVDILTNLKKNLTNERKKLFEVKTNESVFATLER